MAEEFLDVILSSEVEESNFQKWLLKLFDAESTKCSLEEFGVFFFNFMRQQTEVYLRSNSTPTCFTPRKISLPDNILKLLPTDVQNLSTTNLDDSLQLKSTPVHRKKARTSLTQEFGVTKPDQSDNMQSSFENRFSSATSTPIRTLNKSDSFNVSYESNNSYDKSRSRNFSLGDFMVINTRGKKKSSTQSGSVSLIETSSKNCKTDMVSTKPKKRVVPTTLSKSFGDGFTSPAFRNENNILQINESEELIEISQNRVALKSEISEISKQIEEMAPVFHQQGFRSAIEEKLAKTPTKSSRKHVLDLNKVTHKKVINRFVNIYSVLIDLNISTNILTELSFLLNILNADEDHLSSVSEISQKLQSVDVECYVDPKLINNAGHDIYAVFNNITNCIYFALEVLDRQRNLIAMLDLITLRVVLDNGRLSEFAKDLKEHLLVIYNEKSKLDSTKLTHETSFPTSNKFSSVFYQQENDTRSNFPSENEFGAFKRQRDLFYSVLKIWESNHLNHTWNFESELRPKICSIFHQSDHPINMAHLSKLFVSQLIMSATYSESPTDLGFSLSNVDANKLNKLQQRFVAPSNFSTSYQFAGNQSFFKDFLLNANSVVFAEQVKIALAAELLDLNSSSFEILNLSSNEDEEYGIEYVVRPDVMTTMKIMAKFLGLVVSRPFAYDGIRKSSLDKKQTELRNVLQPSFDVVKTLKTAVHDRKLLITIPWLVQYVSMLEPVTLQLTYYQQLIHLLYELYLNLKSELVPDILKLRPTSIFIIQTCLGWLFDQVNMSADYYTYRQNRQYMVDIILADMHEMKLFIPKSCLNTELTTLGQVVVTNLSVEDGITQCSLVSAKQYGVKKELSICKRMAIDPLLEQMLNVSCPFLADFRVAIMPSKFSKCVSRSGRYRHITTKISESSKQINATAEKGSRSKLIEAFLHSQSLSVRRIIEFVIERTSSAVIKDFQMEILLPSKSEALSKVKSIPSNELNIVRKNIKDIYTEAFKAIMTKWDHNIPIMMEERAKLSLNALLPNETLTVVKNTCLSLILEKCQCRTSDWRRSNLKSIDFYTRDINEDADNLIKSKSMEKQIVHSTFLEINREDVSLSALLGDLQYWLHFTIFRPELVSSCKLELFLDSLRLSMDDNKLPYFFFRVVGIKTVDLIQNLIERHMDLITNKVISQFVSIWSHSGMNDLTKLAKNPKHDMNEINTIQHYEPNIFDGLITIAFIRSLRWTKSSFNKLGMLLIKLVSVNLLSVDFLNTKFVNLYRVEMPDDCLKEISNLLDEVVMTAAKSVPSIVSDNKSHLFMEMLADLGRNNDDF